MNPNFLDFEQPIAELEAKIEELRYMSDDSELNINEEVSTLEKKCETLTRNIFSKLKPWQVAQVARHPLRPYSLDYIGRIFTDYQELHGDRHFGDDAAIVGGLARLDGRAVMVIGQQKGRDTAEKIRRNFGMPRPEGYRKALRLMQMAAKFGLPILTLIDTPGAFPGIDAEERGQSEAIARNLLVMAELEVPIVCTVIGEGGSGGALAIGVGDHVMLMEHSTYSVISPEGCASILWKSAERAPEAAESLGLTSSRLLELKLIDEVVKEPLGGAHRDPDRAAANLKQALLGALDALAELDPAALIRRRHDRLNGLGRFREKA